MPGLNQNPDSYEDFDVAAAAADVAGSLFPDAGPNDGGETTIDGVAVGAEGANVPEAAAGGPVEPQNQGTVVPGQNSTIKALPKSWKKDMAPHWEKLDPAVHDYVYAREADVMRGIQQYQQGAQSWNNLLQPFAPIFQQHPDVNPVSLMQGLMNSHLQLLNPSTPAEKKLEFAKSLLAEYGISLDGAAQTPADETLRRELTAVRNELLQLKQGFTQTQQNAYNTGVKQQEALVADFASKNDFFDEVATDIFRFIQTGVAVDLKSAYDMAIWANPAVRAKVLAKQQASANPGQKQPGKKTFPNLDSVETPAPRSRKAATIDQTIDSIVASHYSGSKH